MELTLTHVINNFPMAIMVDSSTEASARKYWYASEAHGKRFIYLRIRWRRFFHLRNPLLTSISTYLLEELRRDPG